MAAPDIESKATDHEQRRVTSDVELRVYRLDTNRYGNACAFVFPDATLGIVDWGTKNIGQFVQLLQDVKATRVRFVAATHSHGDHTKGLEALLIECVQRRIPVGGFFYTAIGRLKGGPYDYLGNAAVYAAQNKIPVHDVSLRNFPPGHVERRHSSTKPMTGTCAYWHPPPTKIT